MPDDRSYVGEKRPLAFQVEGEDGSGDNEEHPLLQGDKQ